MVVAAAIGIAPVTAEDEEIFRVQNIHDVAKLQRIKNEHINDINRSIEKMSLSLPKEGHVSFENITDKKDYPLQVQIFVSLKL